MSPSLDGLQLENVTLTFSSLVIVSWKIIPLSFSSKKSLEIYVFVGTRAIRVIEKVLKQNLNKLGEFP